MNYEISTKRGPALLSRGEGNLGNPGQRDSNTTGRERRDLGPKEEVEKCGTERKGRAVRLT